jgi:hypothetical protein
MNPVGATPVNFTAGSTQSPRLVSDGDALALFYREKYPEVNSIGALFAIDALKGNRPQHNIHWYIRELDQNWVDANPRGQNLDGVDLKIEKTGDNKTRITISGDWNFDDFRPLAGIATGKAQRSNSAGGFGIGLKETARDMILDGLISSLTVIGEGWSVKYVTSNIDEVNSFLGQVKPRPIAAMSQPWLVAEQRELPKGSYQPAHCSYVLETSNPEVIKAFENFKNYAPHSELKRSSLF